MFYSPRQASIKEVRKKISQCLACLFVLIGLLFSSAALADKQLDAEMAVFYEQVFGEAFVKKRVKKPKAIQKRALTTPEKKVLIINKKAKAVLLSPVEAHPPTFTSSNKTDTLFAKAFVMIELSMA